MLDDVQHFVTEGLHKNGWTIIKSTNALRRTCYIVGCRPQDHLRIRVFDCAVLFSPKVMGHNHLSAQLF